MFYTIIYIVPYCALDFLSIVKSVQSFPPSSLKIQNSIVNPFAGYIVILYCMFYKCEFFIKGTYKE